MSSVNSSIHLPTVEAQIDVQHQMLNIISLSKTILAMFYRNVLEYWPFINAFHCCLGRTRVDEGSKLSILLEYGKEKVEKC